MVKTFYYIAANTLLVTLTNFIVWFALTFWLYLETQSVLATGIIGGSFMAITAVLGMWLGSIVDHNKKKTVLMWSSLITLAFFSLALVLFVSAPETEFIQLTNPGLWFFVFALLAGVLAGNLRGIALPTLVTLLVPDDRRDKANGMTGMIMGLSSSGAGIVSGFALAYLGMFWILVGGVVFTALSIVHLFFISIPEAAIVHTEEKPKKIDIKGTIAVIAGINGLFALIFFTTFNNFLGGVFMALMDPYGLSLMSVQAWGTAWGFLSLGFIAGGMYIAKYGLGKNPLRSLFVVNILMWVACIIFPLQASIPLLLAGILVWTLLMPFIEATEHTIVQKIVPFERQGRVFGFAQSVETAASPVTSFMIGPIAQFIFIPFMTTGAGVTLIGDWFGVGPGRGMALVFIIAAVIGLIVTLVAMRSRPYKLLAARYQAE
ncbi:MAG: MFS transporter [Candidatus Pacebacteria bacterium]|nr:MFS transporter [Candidatus Paceibacterota bacterium]